MNQVQMNNINTRKDVRYKVYRVSSPSQLKNDINNRRNNNQRKSNNFREVLEVEIRKYK